MKTIQKIANLMKSNPVELSGGIFMVMIAGIIVLNATSMQPGAHPAPLLGDKPRTVQNQLTVNGANHPLAVDIWEALGAAGYLGEAEQMNEIRIAAAIREFQTENNLPVTGEPSEDLLARLMLGKFKVNMNEDQIAEKVQSISVMAELAANVSLQAGSSSSVLQVQQALANLGYGPLAVDGILGNETSNAIQEFELDSGLPITGQPSAMLFEQLKFVGALPDS